MQLFYRSNNCYILICSIMQDYIYIYIYIYIYWIHTDAMNNRRNDKDARRKNFLTIFTSHFIARVRKGLLKVCVWEGTGDRTETVIFWPHCYDRQRCVFLVLLMLNWRYRGHSVGWWLSLRHLISIFSGPQLIRAQRPLRPDVAFPTTSRL